LDGFNELVSVHRFPLNGFLFVFTAARAGL